jgi:hypothetical protein
MLAHLDDRVSDRKLRLFACAWLRSDCPEHVEPKSFFYRLNQASQRFNRPDSWAAAAKELLTECRRALAVAERYADGAAAEEERGPAYRAALDWANGWCSTDVALSYACCLAAAAAAAPGEVTRLLFSADPYRGDAVGDAARARARARQAKRLREIIGNPFRPVTVDPRWLEWDGGAVPAMAWAVYDERRFSGLGDLAKALARAGCRDAHLLRHLRSWGRHYRGCWALDALLGKA